VAGVEVGADCSVLLDSACPQWRIEEAGERCVLVDDGPPERWRYDFVPDGI
jgi:hypothetical protein